VTDDAVLTAAEGAVLVITLNRPRVHNAIDSALARGLMDALARLEADDGLRVGILTGAGGSFCAGMDLRAFAQGGLPEGIDDVFRHGCAKPLLAAVEGPALGGGLELALVADLIVAARSATFGSPEARFGLFPGGGALLRLPRHLPQSLVAWMALSGEPLEAAAAYEHGLVVRLTERGQALEVAREMAAPIAANAPLSVAAARAILRLVPGRSEDELWREQRALVESVFGSQDAAEGARSFAEKRPPVWRGR
jgi:enoyl-CoA hydratase